MKITHLWIVLLPALAGCAAHTSRAPSSASAPPPSNNAAVATFAKANTCPAARVAVVRRDDIAPHTVVSPARAPSPEIAADPERLTMWQHEQRRQFASLDRSAAHLIHLGGD